MSCRQAHWPAADDDGSEWCRRHFECCKNSLYKKESSVFQDSWMSSTCTILELLNTRAKQFLQIFSIYVNKTSQNYDSKNDKHHSPEPDRADQHFIHIIKFFPLLSALRPFSYGAEACDSWQKGPCPPILSGLDGEKWMPLEGLEWEERRACRPAPCCPRVAGRIGPAGIRFADVTCRVFDAVRCYE